MSELLFSYSSFECDIVGELEGENNVSGINYGTR